MHLVERMVVRVKFVFGSIVLLTSWACAGQSPAPASPSPMPGPEEFAEVWRGKYKIASCRHLTGGGSSYCRFVLNAEVPFELKMTRTGSSVTGVLSFFNSIGQLLLTGQASGTVDTSGEMRLTAVVRSAGVSEGQETTRIDDWRSHAVGGGMSGEFTRQRSFTNAFGPQTSEEGCLILSAARVVS